MNPLKAILFDLDGTILDTEPAAIRTLRILFERWEKTLQPGDAELIVGRTWKAALELLIQKHGAPVSVQAAIHRAQALYREILQEGITPLPGVQTAVRNLQKTYRLAVVSGSLNEEIEWALARLQLRDAFEFVLGGDEYPESKPSPIGYQMAIQRMGLRPSEVLVFEDSTPGIESALRAGTWVVAVTGAHFLPQTTTGVHGEIKNFMSINAQWIQNFSQNHLKP